jgi:hypothetical protein
VPYAIKAMMEERAVFGLVMQQALTKIFNCGFRKIYCS